MADILNGKRFIAAKLGIVWFSGFTEELNVMAKAHKININCTQKYHFLQIIFLYFLIMLLI
jgi:hypothetical protein